MVVTSEPSAWTAKTVQDLALRPSMSTVQAPHWLVSQPTCVPVRLRCSRRKWTRSIRGSTCALRTLPFTVIETWTMRPSSAHSLYKTRSTPKRNSPSQTETRHDALEARPSEPDCWKLGDGSREFN